MSRRYAVIGRAVALAEIRSELGADSWVVRQIEAFEAQVDPEARWVKYLDKCMPKLTHALHGGRAIRAQGVTLEATARRVAGQIAHVEATSPDLPEAAEFGRAAWALVEQTWATDPNGSLRAVVR